nr:hypothetical protein [Tanacetum cinerariifolium]
MEEENAKLWLFSKKLQRVRSCESFQTKDAKNNLVTSRLNVKFFQSKLRCNQVVQLHHRLRLDSSLREKQDENVEADKSLVSVSR